METSCRQESCKSKKLPEDLILNRIIDMGLGEDHEIGSAPNDVAHLRRMIGVGLERLQCRIDLIDAKVGRIEVQILI